MEQHFCRQQLYDLVWSEPLTLLAPRFGMSDVALAKICKRHSMLLGSVIVQHQGQLLLRDHPMLGQWSRLLRKAMAVMDHFQALKARRVEAGLFDVEDLQWFSEWKSERTPSRRNDTREARQSQDWGPEAQLTFLTDAYNRVRDLFALERSTEAEVTRILQQFDPERFRERV